MRNWAGNLEYHARRLLEPAIRLVREPADLGQLLRDGGGFLADGLPEHPDHGSDISVAVG